jgi:hypothetical protein
VIVAFPFALHSLLFFGGPALAQPVNYFGFVYITVVALHLLSSKSALVIMWLMFQTSGYEVSDFGG